MAACSYARLVKGTRDLGPAGSARILRTDLRQAREAVGRTQAEIAERLGWSTSKLARIESGDVGIGVNDLRALCSTLELGSAITDEMIRRAKAARSHCWWHEFRADIEPGYSKLIGLEAESDQLDEFSTAAVPGLLQTQQYGEALHRALFPSMEPQQIATRVALRIRRQTENFDVREAPEMRVLLDESALYRQIGSRTVMAEQITRLAELARRPYLTLRVLPFESPVIWPESFLIIRNAVTGVVVYNESRLGDILIDDQRAVQQFERQFSLLWEKSLDSDQTSQLLHRIGSSYAAGDNPRPWLWA